MFVELSEQLRGGDKRVIKDNNIQFNSKNKCVDWSNNAVIRKLTPTECFLLMGFTKEDIDKCYDMGLSDSALYKVSGNSIVTKCIEMWFEHLYKAMYDESYKCIDENFQVPSPTI